MQAVLVMIRSDGERRSFSIARDMTVVGRREDCDLRIPLGEISRKHCRLVRDGDSCGWKTLEAPTERSTTVSGSRSRFFLPGIRFKSVRWCSSCS